MIRESPSTRASGQHARIAGVFQEIVPLERFVASEAPADAEGNVIPAAQAGMGETTVTVSFEELGDGKTRVTLRRAGFPDDTFTLHADGGWNQAFDKLAEALAAA